MVTHGSTISHNGLCHIPHRSTVYNIHARKNLRNRMFPPMTKIYDLCTRFAKLFRRCSCIFKSFSSLSILDVKLSHSRSKNFLLSSLLRCPIWSDVMAGFSCSQMNQYRSGSRQRGKHNKAGVLGLCAGLELIQSSSINDFGFLTAC
jgi:hypothetical protein